MNKVNAEQLVEGIVAYIDNNVVKSVEDRFLKIATKTVVISAVKNKTAYIKLVNDSVTAGFVSDLLKTDEEGYFEIEDIVDALRQAINDCGELTIKIPPIKFLSPEEKILSFTAADISSLKQYITNAANKGGTIQ